jgi:Domain of unknown function (DUF397)
MSSSGSNGAVPPIAGQVWRRASYCYTGECVEVSTQDGTVMIRDSKDPQGGTLRIDAGEWQVLVGDIKAGMLDNL